MDERAREELAGTLVELSRSLLGLAVQTVGEGPVEVTVVQHRVLVLLWTQGTLTITEIARQLGVDQSNASRHCARLERLDLLSRRRARHDGRAVDVVLTARGERQVRAVHEARRRAMVGILARMSDEDARAVAGALQRFAEAAAGDLAET